MLSQLKISQSFFLTRFKMKCWDVVLPVKVKHLKTSHSWSKLEFSIHSMGSSSQKSKVALTYLSFLKQYSQNAKVGTPMLNMHIIISSQNSTTQLIALFESFFNPRRQKF